MIHEFDIRVLPQIAYNERNLIAFLEKEKALKGVRGVTVLRRSIDARQKTVFVNLKVRVFVNENPAPIQLLDIIYQDVGTKPAVVVVGAGPGGLFAALKLIELGLKPIVLERGKDVSARKVDIANISTKHVVDSESNYSFGEGGAGAYSDGKLYTRSKKRGDIDRILHIFCLHGANPNILVDAHPHLGTDKLPSIIKNMRERIISSGGEVHFEERVDNLIIQKDEVVGVVTNKGMEYMAPVILATGHSARDTYRMLHQNAVSLESKSLAVGVRLEHPQHLIDQIQYHNKNGRGDYLPAAEYSFVTQKAGRGVYSFCMCPGGFVVPAASDKNQVVVNGMSPSKRSSRWANSGMVVEVREEDLAGNYGSDIFSMMNFQQSLENLAYINGGCKQIAPAQRMSDYVNKKVSYELPSTSYTPGVVSQPLHFLLPDFIDSRLREAFVSFGKYAHGFLTREALLIGFETRTSSPLRIVRDSETLMNPSCKGLFPCGEGAGYAGGIVSAAVDGERCALAAYHYLMSK